MRRLWLVFFACLALIAQSSKAKKQAKHQPDPEDRWICHLGSYHDCKCPMMMAEAEEAWIKKCEKEKDYTACMAKRPANCDVIQKPDEKHPEHSCKRTCKAMAGCKCENDSPVCKGPVLNQPSAEDDQ